MTGGLDKQETPVLLVDKDRLRAFLKRPCAQRAGGLTQPSRNNLRVMTGPSNRRLI